MLNRRSMMFGAVAGLGLAGGGVADENVELRDKALELMQVRIDDSPVQFKVLKHNRWHPYGLSVFSSGKADSDYGYALGSNHTIYCASKQERQTIINELIALGAIEDTSEPILLRDKV